jgi:hypothetical protein
MFYRKIIELVENDTQAYKETLIKLAIFFYQVDMQFRAAEQIFFDEWMRGLDWDSGVAAESFKSHWIGASSRAIDSNDDEVIKTYLSSIVDELKSEGAKKDALRLVLDVVISDMEYTDVENKWVEKLRLILEV